MVKGQKAPQRRAMMASPESNRRLDLQRYAGWPGWHFVHVMAAKNKKTPSLNRGKLTPNLGDPVDFRQFRKRKGLGVKGHRKNLQHHLVRCLKEIGPHFPQARAILYLEDTHPDGFGHHPLHSGGKGARCGFAR